MQVVELAAKLHWLKAVRYQINKVCSYSVDKDFNINRITHYAKVFVLSLKKLHNFRKSLHNSHFLRSGISACLGHSHFGQRIKFTRNQGKNHPNITRPPNKKRHPDKDQDAAQIIE